MRLNRSGHVETAQRALELAEHLADEGRDEQAQTQALIASGHALVAEWVPERKPIPLGQGPVVETITRVGDGR